MADSRKVIVDYVTRYFKKGAKEAGDDLDKVKEKTRSANTEGQKRLSLVERMKREIEAENGVVHEATEAIEELADATQKQADAAHEGVDANESLKKKINEVGDSAQSSKDDLEAAPAQLDGIMNRLAAIKALSRGLGSAMKILGAAIEVAAKGTREFQPRELAEIDLQATLARQGKFSQEFIDQLDQLAIKMEKVSDTAARDWLPVLAELLESGGNETNIDALAEMFLQLSTVLNNDTSRAMHLVQEALKGNYEGFEDIGIVINKTGNEVKDLNTLMQDLAARGGQQLEAQNRRLGSELKDVQLALTRMWEAVGRNVQSNDIWIKANDRVRAGFNALESTIEGVTNWLSRGAEKAHRFNNEQRRGKIDAAAYAEALEKAEEKVEGLTKGFEEAGRAARELHGQFAALNQVKLDIELAEIEQQLLRGKLSPEEADRRKGAATAAARQRELQSERESILRERIARQEELKELTDRRAANNNALSDANIEPGKRERLLRENVELQRMIAEIRGNIAAFIQDTNRDLQIIDLQEKKISLEGTNTGLRANKEERDRQAREEKERQRKELARLKEEQKAVERARQAEAERVAKEQLEREQAEAAAAAGAVGALPYRGTRAYQRQLKEAQERAAAEQRDVERAREFAKKVGSGDKAAIDSAIGKAEQDINAGGNQADVLEALDTLTNRVLEITNQRDAELAQQIRQLAEVVKNNRA